MSLLGDLIGKILPASKAAPPMFSPTPQPTQAQAPPPKPAAAVDIDAVLEGLMAKKGLKLDWRHSIVDLMKLLDMDSSLTSRRELAKELHYSGDWNDTAAMNIWLRKQVMQKVADNGGKVPSELLH